MPTLPRWLQFFSNIYSRIGAPSGASVSADILAIYTALTAGTYVGNLQLKATTIDLHDFAGNYTLYTGATQSVWLTALAIALPNIDVSDDAAITGISIQTNQATPQILISSVQGAKAYLTAQAQLGWRGRKLIRVGDLIQLTIIGGTATADPTTCDVVAEYRAVVAGGTLA